MSVPSQINDGDWRIPNYGKPTITYPFSSKGDTQSVEVSFSFQIDKAAYRTPDLNDLITVPGINQNCHLIDPGSPQDIGNGLYQVNPVYATIPITRTEPRTVVADLFYAGSEAGSFTLTLQGKDVYEYSLIYPKAISKLRILTTSGGAPFLVNPDQQQPLQLANTKGPIEFLSEDSEIGIYKGKIFYRKLTYAYFNWGAFLDGIF